MKKILAIILCFSVIFAFIPTDKVHAAQSAAEAYYEYFNPDNGHVYAIIDKSLSWLDAKTYCENLGGHLATITTQAEQNFINKMIYSSDNITKENYWLGATDQIKEGQWIWVTGEIFNYQNWDSGEPNNTGAKENYLSLYHKVNHNGKWNDYQVAGDTSASFNNYGIICEWDYNKNGYSKIFNAENGHDYTIINLSLSWNEANTYCSKLGGHLVTITSQSEQNFITNILKSGQKKNYWLGATDQDKEGTYKWVTGEIFSYVNWSNGEPNNSGKKEHYLGMYYNNDPKGYWNDFCDTADSSRPLNTFGFVCEWDNGKNIYAKYYNSENKHDYAIIELPKNWNDAKAYCESLGGHLATITSPSEQNFVNGVVAYGTKNSYFIGAKEDTYGKFSKWITDEPISYTNYSYGQPDNFTVNGDVLMLYRVNNPLVTSNLGEWNDIRFDGTCNNEKFFGLDNFGFLCEWDNNVWGTPTPIPTPTPTATPTPTPIATPTVPPANIITPANGSVLDDTDFNVSWNKVSWAWRYKVTVQDLTTNQYKYSKETSSTHLKISSRYIENWHKYQIFVYSIDQNRNTQSVANSIITISHNYKQGDRGDFIKQIQKRLIGKGYNYLKINGKFDYNTMYAVNLFKDSNKILNSGNYRGIVDKDTWDKLTSGVWIIYRDNGDMVTKLRTMLVSLGYQSASKDKANTYGKNTYKAVNSFKKNNRIYNSGSMKGVVGDEVWNLLVQQSTFH